MFSMQKMDLLVSLYIFCILVSELMGAKTFPFPAIFGLHLNASVSIFVLPLIYTINDVITEVHGPERTRSIIRSGLIVIVCILLYSILATTLPPSKRFASSESAYQTVFGLSIRFSIASLIAFICSDFLDVYIFTKMKKSLGKSKLWFRNNASNFLSEGIDATIFMTLAFWALDQSLSSNLSFIVGLLIPYVLIRWALSVIETPLVYLGVSWLQEDKKTK
jgi:uncharacterized integral membrane protein (TIGR00697 family)